MKYFLHDTSSQDDEKVAMLIKKFGYEGLGLFYAILERIGKQEHPIKTDVLKHQLRIGKRLEKCWNFLESLELIQSKNGETFNEQLLKFSGKYAVKKEKNLKRISEWREKQKDIKNVTHYNDPCNTPQIIKDNNKIIKENIKGINTCEVITSHVVENDSEPEIKKPATEPKKNKKKDSAAAEKPTSVHSQCKEIFISEGKKNDKIVYWTGREGRSLNEIITKIKFLYLDTNKKEATDEETVQGFEILITNLPEWDKQNNYDINSINSGFNRISNKLKSGNGFNQTNSETDDARVLEEFRRSKRKDAAA